ncbi:hypothetical protein GWO57_05170 [Corynebacterium macginleyi]|uniref:hypothetical protein n=1 Tax=Corynebacterium macginleyi TaxID=38290 RepID=UPI00190AF7D4|nr:hypothetical protein [Corynebacterium macginleyi]MBK4144064.1 hypothetical protein [Corynebacterium macginleyi]
MSTICGQPQDAEGSAESDSRLVGATEVDGSVVTHDVNVGIDANQLSDTADSVAWSQ